MLSYGSSFGSYRNFTIRFMPIPIIDASQALKANPEKTEDALLKVGTSGDCLVLLGALCTFYSDFEAAPVWDWYHFSVGHLHKITFIFTLISSLCNELSVLNVHVCQCNVQYSFWFPLLKMESYLFRNHETRKYLQGQAYRLQQGIVTTTTQQVSLRLRKKLEKQKS